MDDINIQNPTLAREMPKNTWIDDKAIKKIAGEAIMRVEGVLGLEGGLADMLKSGDDVTKGLSITLSEDGRSATVSAKIITEYGKNIPAIVSTVQDRVAESLRAMSGIAADTVEVEVTDTMTANDYKTKAARGRA